MEKPDTPTDWTVLLSGPLAQKGPLLASLDRAGVDRSDDDLPDSYWRLLYGEDDPTQGWVRVRHPDPDAIGRPKAPAKKWTDANDVEWTAEQWHTQFGPAGIATLAGWRVRATWATPTCGACSGLGSANQGTSGLSTCRHCQGKKVTNRPAPTAEQLLRADLEQMKAELAALRGTRY